jgi:hypothetical protein
MDLHSENAPMASLNIRQLDPTLKEQLRVRAVSRARLEALQFSDLVKIG